jgi:hypothetical protein
MAFFMGYLCECSLNVLSAVFCHASKPLAYTCAIINMHLYVAIYVHKHSANMHMHATIHDTVQPEKHATNSYHAHICRFSRDEETGQTVIEGMGELHLEIIVDRMRREFNVECNVGAPQVRQYYDYGSIMILAFVFQPPYSGSIMYTHTRCWLFLP